jgi:ABC-type glycerol-3-phosphate transport system substrate-binding protein
LGIEPDQLNGVTVEFWHGFSGARAEVLAGWGEAFNGSNPFGISVLLTPSEDVFNAVQDAIRAGEPPDLTMGFTYQAAAWDQATPPRTNLVDLTLYLTDPVYGFTPEEQGDFYPAFLQQETVDGRLMGLPAYRSGQVMFYNVSWAQELGFQTPPTTPDEFKQQACAAAQARGDGTGGWFLSTDTATTLGWIFGFGGQILAGDTYQFNTPETAAAFRFIKDLDESGCAWRAETTFPNAAFAAREGLFYASSLSGLAVQQQAFADAGNADTWTIIPFPSPDGQPRTFTFGPAYNVLATTAEEQLAAWLFVKWASAPENQVRWTEVGGSFPTRGRAIGLLNAYVAGLPQWTRAYDLIPAGQTEPALVSWGTVRWVVGDAMAQLFGFGFTAEQIPGVVEELDRTANELGGE